MYKGSRIASLRPSLFKVLRFSTTGSALVFCLLGCPLGLVFADPLGTIDPTQSVDWARGAVSHAQKMRAHKDVDTGSQPPGVIPQFSADPDPSGQIATFQPEATEGNNAFFQNLGTNGRTKVLQQRISKGRSSLLRPAFSPRNCSITRPAI